MGEHKLSSKFLCVAHSSAAYTKWNKLPLHQYLYLGLPVILTKHLSAGSSIASGRVCKGIDLKDRLLMPKLSYVGPNVKTWERENFEYGGQTKKKKRATRYFFN